MTDGIDGSGGQGPRLRNCYMPERWPDVPHPVGDVRGRVSAIPASNGHRHGHRKQGVRLALGGHDGVAGVVTERRAAGSNHRRQHAVREAFGLEFDELGWREVERPAIRIDQGDENLFAEAGPVQLDQVAGGQLPGQRGRSKAQYQCGRSDKAPRADAGHARKIVQDLGRCADTAKTALGWPVPRRLCPREDDRCPAGRAAG
jgi:hypothetical protein